MELRQKLIAYTTALLKPNQNQKYSESLKKQVAEYSPDDGSSDKEQIPNVYTKQLDRKSEKANKFENDKKFKQIISPEIVTTTQIPSEVASNWKELNGQNFSELGAKITDSAVHTSCLFDGSMAIIRPEQILIARKQKATSHLEIHQTIPMDSIHCLVVREEMQIIDVLLKPYTENIPFSSITIIPKRIEETEVFINHLLIASCSVKKANVRNRRYSWPAFLNVTRCSSLLNMPCSSYVKQYFCKLNSKEIKFSFHGMALAFPHEGRTKYCEELMFQEGAEKPFPVKVELVREEMLLFKTGENSSTHQPHLKILLDEISCVRQTDVPRPHSCCIVWNSRTFYLAACTESTANEWFDRICHAKRKFKVEKSQAAAAHVIIAETTLYIFSHENNKLLESPLLNIAITTAPSTPGQDLDKSIVFETLTLEAEEIISYENERWSLQFVTSTEANRFYNYCMTETENAT